MMMDVGRPLPGELVSIPTVTAELLELARASSVHDIAFYEHLLDTCLDARPQKQSSKNCECWGSSTPGRQAQRSRRRDIAPSSSLPRLLVQRVPEFLMNCACSNRHFIGYELVREGMTSRFIKGLLTEPGFQRLYICSPWINLQKPDLGRLATALNKAHATLARPPELLIVAQTPKIPELQKSLDTLRRLGAEVVEKPRLHSKLYMREPGPSGGLSLAIVGSENLTRQKWIELGIEIRNDSQLLSKLRSYFFQVFGQPEGE